VSFVVEGFTALCLRPSARTPPPIALLLKTKAKPQFDRTVDQAVEALFGVFQPPNHDQFQHCFFVFTVRSAEGRRSLQLPNMSNTKVPAFG
jgi:hypothetical protein